MRWCRIREPPRLSLRLDCFPKERGFMFYNVVAFIKVRFIDIQCECKIDQTPLQGGINC